MGQLEVTNSEKANSDGRMRKDFGAKMSQNYPKISGIGSENWSFWKRFWRSALQK